MPGKIAVIMILVIIRTNVLFRSAFYKIYLKIYLLYYTKISNIFICETLIQSHLDWDEKRKDMCDGAYESTCWTFATKRESRIPCKVPMIETDTADELNICLDELCFDIAENFVQTFFNEGYVISPGAAIVCEVAKVCQEKKCEIGVIKGMIRQSIGEDVNLNDYWSPKTSCKSWR